MTGIEVRRDGRAGFGFTASRPVMRAFRSERNIEISFRGYSQRPLNLATSNGAIRELNRCARRYFGG